MSARSIAAAVLVGVVLVAGAFVAGRYTAPVKVEVQTVERVKTVTVKGEDRVVVRRIVVEKKPDGSEKTTVDETERAKTDERVVSTEKTEGKTVTSTARPQWRVSVLAGSDDLLHPSKTSLVVGGLAERRVFGPVYAGAWWMGGVGGAGDVGRMSAGLSVGVEF